MRKTEVLGIPLTDYTIRESMKKVDSFFKDGRVSTIAVITMKGLLVAHEDESIKEWMTKIDLAVPADVEILRAGDIAFHNRIRDVENNVFVTEFFKRLARQKKTVFLLSDNSTKLEKLKKEILSYEEDIRIIGSFSLDSTENGDDYVVNEINMAFADVLISNLESPGRESFLAENHMKLNVAIWMMVRADVDLSEKGNGFLRKLDKQILKKIFSARLIRYHVQNAEQERAAENAESKTPSEGKTESGENEIKSGSGTE